MLQALIICGILSTAAAVLPPGWKPCSKSAPDHNECIRRNLETALETLRKGDPALGLPRIEPFIIKHFDLTVSDDFRMMLDNGTVDGFTDVKINKVENIPWKSLKIHMETKMAQYNFNYSASGVIFNIKVNSSGYGFIRTNDAVQDLEIFFSDFEKDGKTYLKVDDIIVSETIKSVAAEFHPHGRSSAYKSMINRVINENWHEMLAEQAKNGHPATKRLLMNFANSVLEKIPKEDFDME